MKKRCYILGMLCVLLLSACTKPGQSASVDEAVESLPTDVIEDGSQQVPEEVEIPTEVPTETPTPTPEPVADKDFNADSYWFDETTDSILCTTNKTYVLISNKYHTYYEGTCADNYIIVDGNKYTFTIDEHSAVAKIGAESYGFMKVTNEDFSNVIYPDFSPRLTAEVNNFSQPVVEEPEEEEEEEQEEVVLYMPEGMESYAGSWKSADGAKYNIDIVIQGHEEPGTVHIEVGMHNVLSQETGLFSEDATFEASTKYNGYYQTVLGDQYTVSIKVDGDTMDLEIHQPGNSFPGVSQKMTRSAGSNLDF